MVAATFWLLLTPTPAFAATGSANCAGGKPVTCAAEICHCTDNVGCSACNTGANGNITCEHTNCKKSEEWLD